MVSCNSGLSSCTRASAWHASSLFLAHMLRQRVEATSASFTASSWLTSLEVLWAMRASSLRPDVRSHTRAMKLCAAAMWRASIQLLGHMEGNQVSYSSVSEERWACALQLLEVMAWKRMPPMATNVGFCMNACQKQQEWARAVALLSEMLSRSMEANVICFGAALSACETVGNWPLALCLLRCMASLRLRLNSITYNATLGALARRGELPMALEMLEGMGDMANVVSYSTCIAACQRGGRWQTALDLLGAKDPALQGPFRMGRLENPLKFHHIHPNPADLSPDSQGFQAPISLKMVFS